MFRSERFFRPDIHPYNFSKILHFLGTLYSDRYIITDNIDDYKKAKSNYELEIEAINIQDYPYSYSVAKQALINLHLKYAIQDFHAGKEILIKDIEDLIELLLIETFQ